MGLLIAALVLAPLVGAAGALDWRARRRRRTQSPVLDHRTATREIRPGLDIGDLEN